MAVLTREEILKLIKEEKLFIEPFNEEVIRENGLDLRIGYEYAFYSFENKIVDLTEIENSANLFSIVEAKDGKIVIKPNSFVLLSTIEYIKFPNNVIGFCNLRSTLARYGLSVPPTIIDAGFEGNITIELINTSNNYVVLKPGLRFLHVVLEETVGEIEYKGVYKGQRGVRLPKGLKEEFSN
ncbi:MAG: dCTP deaminase [Patescibacteria group bacterium]